MKKIAALTLAFLLIFSLAACSNTQAEESSQQTESTPVEAPETEPSQEADNSDISEADAAPTESNEEPADSKILIAYFTYGENAELPSDVDASTTASIQIFNGEVTGNTGVMAHMIAEASGGELFSIRTVEPYPDSYDATIDVGQSEKNDGIRPELSTHIENLDQYDTVFVGFPNWWYGMPMVMYSFFDEYDFSGKTIIPFCTSGGSAFSDAVSEITSMEPEATVLEGLHIGGSSVNDAESRVNEWVSELGLSK
ncbi:flavodoxin [Enterocloster bolteae]|uniref:flavodoxin n=1 Tax=Enterocloster bolteae TaxID=208479 RepID=UPI0028DC7C3D|nr:flavodoxin [Enterocloster bolteae]